MIDIWEKFSRVKTTSQRLADQTRMIIKQGWFSGLKILKIHQQINRKTCQLEPNTITQALNTEESDPHPATESERQVRVIEKPHIKKKT